MKKRKRPYVQTTRLQLQEQTRLRIVEALVELHQKVGPKNTTIAAVAKRAGVQRLTVYRHFEDESSMLQACSGHWATQNPPPHEDDWQTIENLHERVYAALLAINKYFSKTEAMLAKVYRDASEVEALGPIMKGFDDHFNNIANNLALNLTNGETNDKLGSVARHLVRFSTWQSLSQENLSEEEIAQVGLIWMKKLVKQT
jgi:AcrR family transcriptional regulator